jgi:hypothetical protein
MGRRAKTGYQSRSNADIRNHTLRNLISLNSALMDQTLDCKPLPLMQELNRRYEEHMKKEESRVISMDMANPQDYSKLILDYLNTDDVMKVLGCNRRSAVDYLSAMRQIHVMTASDAWTTAIIAGRV